jgi:hypothetical protein
LIVFATLATQIILHGEEDEAVEQQLDERNKFARTSQGQAGSLVWIERFTVGVINHRSASFATFS